MEEVMAYVVQHRILLTGLATAAMGCTVRISYSKEVESFKFKQILGYYFTGIFLGYLCFSALELLGFERATGLAGAIAGVLSREAMGFIINDIPRILPAVFKKWVYKKLGLEDEEKK